MKKGNGKPAVATVVIGGAMCSVGTITQNGFTVCAPRKAMLDVPALLKAISMPAFARTNGHQVYTSLRDFCTKCLSIGKKKATKVAVDVVGSREVEGVMYYLCICKCGVDGPSKEQVFGSRLLELEPLATDDTPAISPVVRQTAQTKKKQPAVRAR